MAAPTANKIYQIPKSNEGEPKDSIRKSGNNNVINNNNNNIYSHNLPKMQRQHSSSSSQRGVSSMNYFNKNPQFQQNINYNTEANFINNNNVIHTIYNKPISNMNNTQRLYQSAHPQDSYHGKGNNKQK